MIPKPATARDDTSTLLPFEEYDYIIVSFSGGKDSTACVLHLLELGVDPGRIELWHQAVDGRPGHDERLWDWPCTEAYCRAFAEALGCPLYFQWKEGGYLGEMLREHEGTAPTSFETPDGDILEAAQGRVRPRTRMRFPQVSKDLSVRWCSAYLKIDVASKVFTNDPRFSEPGTSALIITGERRQESGGIEGRAVGRALYAEVDRHKATTRTRRVDQWRAVLGWEESEVWAILERNRVRPHPAYYLGWSRVSCMPCIFGDPHQWASVQAIAPRVFDRLLAYEHQFTEFHNAPAFIRKGGDLEFWAAKGEAYDVDDVPDELSLAMSEDYPTDLVIVPEGEDWVLPKGAYGHAGGPT